MPDPRGRCGRWYSLSSLLARCAAAIVAGAVTAEAVCESAVDAPTEVLAALGIRRHPLGRKRSPTRQCLTSLLARIDGDALDRAVCAWLAAPLRPARSCPETLTGHYHSSESHHNQHSPTPCRDRTPTPFRSRSSPRAGSARTRLKSGRLRF
ncbi:transposase family protein [Glycomyces sp. TRM65418]|uniref:transposase family protein n=1 Tax=Glycomyces sp. TRM65418 TaxID=2867006 RepID=UPI001CE4CFF7|nr:transposase family protein [Glycomyces sp. TRM65418]QZD56600.1 transposase family protein [Glycomyces sp. TRM65418]